MRNCILQHMSIVILAILFCQSARAQIDTDVIFATKRYVKYIDSINNLDGVQDRGFMKGVADGVVKTAEGNTVNTVGGFGVYTLANLKWDTVFRIEYHINVPLNIYKI